MNSLPTEIKNHILSFRQTHPVAKLIRDAHILEMNKWNEQKERYEFEFELQYGTFVELEWMWGCSEDIGVFKNGWVWDQEDTWCDSSILWSQRLMEDYRVDWKML